MTTRRTVSLFGMLVCALFVAALALAAVPARAQAATAITYTLSTSSSSAKIRSIAGADQYATAVQIAKAAFPNGVSSKTAIIASGESGAWPDAMSASPLAGAIDCPILYTSKGIVPDTTLKALKSLKVNKVIIVGGTSVVSNSVRKQLAGAGMSVTRLAGSNAPGTQMAIYNYGLKNGLWNESNAIVVTLKSFKDALSISPVAAKLKYPLFLVPKTGSLSSAQVKALRASGVTRFVIVGGTSAVSGKVGKKLEAIAESHGGLGSVERVWGSNAYNTSAEVAKWAVSSGYLKWNNVAFARGRVPKDALAGGVLQGKTGAPLLLIEKDHKEVLSAVKGKGITRARVFGGYKAVVKSVRESIARALNLPFNEIQGHPIKKIPDISLWNDITDMSKFMKSSEFVFIKCTQGTNIVDPQYNKRVKQLNAAKVPHWDYTFMLKGSGKTKAQQIKYAEQQVQYLIDHSNGAVGLVLDVEWYKGGDETLPTVEQTDAAVRYAVKRGYKVVIYYNNAMNPAYHFVALQSDIRSRCATWAACWGKNSGGASAKPDSTCDVHQYTSTGSMPGVKGNCDLSVFYGTTKSLAWFKKR